MVRALVLLLFVSTPALAIPGAGTSSDSSSDSSEVVSLVGWFWWNHTTA